MWGLIPGFLSQWQLNYTDVEARVMMKIVDVVLA